MPAHLKLVVSVCALILCTTTFFLDSSDGTARWIALGLGPLMVLSIWIFPEAKAREIRQDAAERRG